MPIPHDAICEIMDSFDFKAVHDYMKQYNWRWWNGEGSRGVPTMEQLREKALDMLKSLEHAEHIVHGGFYARRLVSGAIELHFTIEHSQAYI